MPPQRVTQMQRGGRRTKKRMFGTPDSVATSPQTWGATRRMRRLSGPTATTFGHPGGPRVKKFMLTADARDRGRQRVKCDLLYAPAPHTYTHAASCRSRMGEGTGVCQFWQDPVERERPLLRPPTCHGEHRAHAGPEPPFPPFLTVFQHYLSSPFQTLGQNAATRRL